MRVTRIVISIVTVLLTASAALTQDRKPLPRSEIDQYIVSAKAGVVNLVEGDATVARALPFAVPEAPKVLISGDELKNGDVVNTGLNGRAEILLNPGCYLRLGEQSEFVFLFDNSVTDKFKLNHGSAVLEASAIDSQITVETPKTSFQITKDGLYRINVNADGRADVVVHKGRVLVGSTTIKEGKRAVVEGGTAAIAKLNKQDVDALDGWSKDRAKALVAANSRLSNVGMRRTLSRTLLYNAWIFDPFCRCYTFLPLYDGFASPYGWDYAVCNPYYYYYNPRRYNNGGGYHGGGGSYSGGGSQGGGSHGGGNGGGTTGGGSIGGGTGGGTRPTSPAMGGNVDRGASRGAATPNRGRVN